MRWRRIIAIVVLAELATLAIEFGLPAVQHRIFADPRFPHVIVFHHPLPSCIVDFQGNVYTFCAISTVLWMSVLIGVAFVVSLVRRKAEYDRKLKYTEVH
jgi:hypothetical protein